MISRHGALTLSRDARSCRRVRALAGRYGADPRRACRLRSGRQRYASGCGARLSRNSCRRNRRCRRALLSCARRSGTRPMRKPARRSRRWSGGWANRRTPIDLPEAYAAAWDDQRAIMAADMAHNLSAVVERGGDALEPGVARSAGRRRAGRARCAIWRRATMRSALCGWHCRNIQRIRCHHHAGDHRRRAEGRGNRQPDVLHVVDADRAAGAVIAATDRRGRHAARRAVDRRSAATTHACCARPIGWSIGWRIDSDCSARRVTGYLLLALEQRLPVVAPEAPEHQSEADQGRKSIAAVRRAWRQSKTM